MHPIENVWAMNLIIDIHVLHNLHTRICCLSSIMRNYDHVFPALVNVSVYSQYLFIAHWLYN